MDSAAVCPDRRIELGGNPLYAGRIAHKGAVYEGRHPGIVNTATWDAVQSTLTENAHQRTSGSRTTEHSPLISKLFDEAGVSLTPTHAVKSGRRYRYCVSRQRIQGASKAVTGEGWRLPALEIERTVTDAVTDVLSDHSAVAEKLRDTGVAFDRIASLLQSITRWRGELLRLVQRADLTAEALSNHTALPLRWSEQRAPLSFDQTA